MKVPHEKNKHGKFLLQTLPEKCFANHREQLL
jgi:hypothetical protein